jgi:hypothetical protein
VGEWGEERLPTAEMKLPKTKGRVDSTTQEKQELKD